MKVKRGLNDTNQPVARLKRALTLFFITLRKIFNLPYIQKKGLEVIDIFGFVEQLISQSVFGFV